MICPDCLIGELEDNGSFLECDECLTQFEVPNDEEDELQYYILDIDEDEDEDDLYC